MKRIVSDITNERNMGRSTALTHPDYPHNIGEPEQPCIVGDPERPKMFGDPEEPRLMWYEKGHIDTKIQSVAAGGHGMVMLRYREPSASSAYSNLARRMPGIMKMESDESGYTAHHDNSSDAYNHSTSDGNSYTTHNYSDNSGRYDPFPVGGNDKWMPNDR